MNEENNISDQIQDAKTDELELNEVLDRYDLDESLAAEFDAIATQFQQLEIRYQSILNTRRFLLNAPN